MQLRVLLQEGQQGTLRVPPNCVGLDSGVMAREGLRGLDTAYMTGLDPASGIFVRVVPSADPLDQDAALVREETFDLLQSHEGDGCRLWPARVREVRGSQPRRPAEPEEVVLERWAPFGSRSPRTTLTLDTASEEEVLRARLHGTVAAVGQRFTAVYTGETVSYKVVRVAHAARVVEIVGTAQSPRACVVIDSGAGGRRTRISVQRRAGSPPGELPPALQCPGERLWEDAYVANSGRLGVFVRSILLWGCENAGKSTILQHLCERLQAPGIMPSARVLRTTGSELVLEQDQLRGEGRNATGGDGIIDSFLRDVPGGDEDGIAYVIIDDLSDALPGSADAEYPAAKAILDNTLRLVATIRRDCRSVVVIAALTAMSQEALTRLLGPEGFETHVEVPLPSAQQRKEAFAMRFNGHRFRNETDEEDMPIAAVADQLSRKCGGFACGDVADLGDRISALTLPPNNQSADVIDILAGKPCIMFEDALSLAREFTPRRFSTAGSTLRMQSMHESLTLADFGGRDGIKPGLRAALDSLCDTGTDGEKTLLRRQIPLSSGIVVTGETGMGKTYLVHCLAGETAVAFIPVHCNSLYSSYLGESEANLRRLFARARQLSPAILLLDGIELIGCCRDLEGGGDSAGSSIQTRLLSTLLNELDGISSSSQDPRGRILVIGTTARREDLDAALLRPGRLGMSIDLRCPSAQERRDILAAQLRQVSVDEALSMDGLADHERLAGATPAELAAVCRAAGAIAAHSGRKVISVQDMHDAIESVIRV